MNEIDTTKAEVLQTINPNDIIAYLENHGWVKLNCEEGKSETWEFKCAKKYANLRIPLRKDFADYAIRMSEILRILGNVEGRSRSIIFNDLRLREREYEGAVMTRAEMNDRLMAEIGAMSDEEFDQAMQRIRDLTGDQSTKMRERDLLLEQAQALVKKYNAPATLQADWDGTNHYELQTPIGGSWWWLTVQGIPLVEFGGYSSIEEGKRLGYALEAAALLPKLVAALEEK